MKLKLPKRRIWRAMIYLVCTLLILLAIDLILIQLGRRITPSYEATRITEPTIPGGPIDYLTALENHFSAGVTPENNAAPLMIEAFGRGALANNQPRDGITSRLGMPPLPDTGDYYQTSNKFPGPRPSDGSESEGIEPLMEKPWTAAEHPQAAAWLEANTKPLAKLTEASKRSRFFYPFNAGYRPDSIAAILVPYLAPMLNSSRALVCRATLRATTGDVAGAHADLMTVHRLAKLLSGGATMIDRIVGYSIDSYASRAAQAIATNGKLDAAQARQWLGDLRRLPELDSFVEGIDISERFGFLDAMQFGARHGLPKFANLLSSGPPGLSPIVLHLLPVRWANAMRVGNVWNDRLIAAATGKPSRLERHAAITKLMQELDQFSRGDGTFLRQILSSDWPVTMFFPGLARIGEREDVAFMQRLLSQLAIALAAYHAEHGAYPAALDALKPAYLPEIHDDPFSGKPFVYRVSKDGYLLYSMGPNQTDEGGQNAPGSKPASALDDLSVRAGSETATTAPVR